MDFGVGVEAQLVHSSAHPPNSILFSSMSSNILTTLTGGSSAQQPAQVEDCASCRLIGGSAAVGVGSYVSYQGVAQMRAQRAATQAGKGGAGKAGAVAMGALGLGTLALFFSLLTLAPLLITSSPFPALYSIVGTRQRPSSSASDVSPACESMMDSWQFQNRRRWRRSLSERTYVVGRRGVRRLVNGGGRSGRECDPSDRHLTPYSHFRSGTTLHKVRKAVLLRSVGSTMPWPNDFGRGLIFARPPSNPLPRPPSSRTYHLPSSPISPPSEPLPVVVSRRVSCASPRVIARLL